MSTSIWFSMTSSSIARSSSDVNLLAIRCPQYYIQQLNPL